MSTLTRDTILAADDLQHEKVTVPEWGGHVWVWTMTGEERDKFEGRFIANRTGDKATDVVNMRAQLVAWTIRDENGNWLFNEDDVAALGRKSGVALDRVFEVAMRLNRIGDTDVEELVGNSASAPNDSSGST